LKELRRLRYTGLKLKRFSIFGELFDKKIFFFKFKIYIKLFVKNKKLLVIFFIFFNLNEILVEEVEVVEKRLKV